MFKAVGFFFYLLQTSIRASISLRVAFLLESTLMLINNLVFFSLWWVFFRQFNDIAGWEMRDVTALMAVGIGSYGLSQICFGGVKFLSRTIMDGDLDPFMTQPKNLLIQLACSRSFSKGWGHLLTTVLLVVLGGLATPKTIPLIIFCIFCGGLVFASTGIIAHSLVFWLGSIENLSRKYCESLYLFVVYPSNIYSGLLQLIMFTLIPAGIIGYLPVELLRHFCWIDLLILMGSASGFFAIACFVFHLGLKKYESGNRFGIRF